MINFFNFKGLDEHNSRYLITNDLGRYLFVSKDELVSLIRNKVDYASNFGKIAVSNYFCYNGSLQAFTEQLKPLYRDSKNYLFTATSLHIFVVTNACNMKCVYCQAQNGKILPNGMMSKETAKKAVDIAMSCPTPCISIEFQGGEPLINFEVIKYIVEYADQIAIENNKTVEYNLVSNLTLLTDEIIDYIHQHNIGVSTSIDGDEILHDQNRMLRDNQGSYQLVMQGINRLRSHGVEFGAIQTTTRKSLTKARDIIDTYVSLGLHSVFIRNLTPLGCASEHWLEIGYSAKEFVEFYKECFDYILELNLAGVDIQEGHATLMLSKILSGYAVNYMELRSPCGAGVGQIAYYYDGNIYTCDEGRMLAEMGNDAFKLGTIDDSYDDLMNCDNCKAACVSSVLESLPSCSDCIYSPFCGTCPVINYALGQDIYCHEPNDYKCLIYKGILDTIFDALQVSEKEKILKSWVEKGE